jgi:hypothetical protein
VAARFFENLWTVAVTLSLAAVGPVLVSHHSDISTKNFIAPLAAYLFVATLEFDNASLFRILICFNLV